MLQQLTIKNYALIDALQLPVNKGFTVITGETGAGKSILLGALALVLGKRADSKSLKNPDEKCVVEAHFEVQSQHQTFFEEYDLDFDSHSILRREILPSGKSRAFINDSPTTLDVVQKLALKLIDIHSQHETILLTDVAFQMDLLDSFAQNDQLLQKYKERYTAYQSLNAQLVELNKLAELEGGDADYLNFLFVELEEARLVKGELEDLEAEFETLSRADEINEKLTTSHQVLFDDSSGALPQLHLATTQLAALGKIGEPYSSLHSRLHSASIELDDLRLELEKALENAVSDPTRAEAVSNRLNKLYSLQKKHQVESIEALLEKKETLDQKVQELGAVDEKRAVLKAKLAEIMTLVKEEANKLHQSRVEAAKTLSENISQILAGLNMVGAQISLNVQEVEKYTALGNSTLSFGFSANKGQNLQALSKIASGGELSRVMLAIKATMAKSNNLPTIIFDEIDTGVSGETAEKIADILSQMGTSMQVLAITHLPQIAAKGKTHIKVVKESDETDTRTNLLVLSKLDREQELARLLSGKDISEAAKQHAREMLQN